MRTRLSVWLAAVGLTIGCALPAATKADDDASAQTGAAGAPGASGCSDGTREAYVDEAAFPNVAGCSGGFQLPGVTTVESLTPQCNRAAGNDSSNVVGSGCSVADLCAEGWRVCESADDLQESSSTGQCPGPEESEDAFWLTRQAQSMSGGCAEPPAMNNLVGCGSIAGDDAGSSCNPLTLYLRVEDCLATATWSCGTVSTSTSEGEDVKKSGDGEGGVLCCREAG